MCIERKKLVFREEERSISREGERYIANYNPSNIFARARLGLTRHAGEYSPVKTGEYPRIFPNF